jgi:hypothetical protein
VHALANLVVHIAEEVVGRLICQKATPNDPLRFFALVRILVLDQEPPASLGLVRADGALARPPAGGASALSWFASLGRLRNESELACPLHVFAGLVGGLFQSGPPSTVLSK